MKLLIDRCPHHGFLAVSVDYEDGGGERLTRGKCCGSWETEKAWWLSAAEWERIAQIATTAARRIRREAEKRT